MGLYSRLLMLCLGTLTAFGLAPDFQGSSLHEFSNSEAVAIPSDQVSVRTSTILVSGAGNFLLDVDVVTTIQHTFCADLDITIQSPRGTIVTLTTDNGGAADDVFNGTLWDDSANPSGTAPYVSNPGLVTDHPFANDVTAESLVPEEALAAFIGENPNGIWKLTVSDDTASDGGMLSGWSVLVTTVEKRIALPEAVVTENTNALAIPIGPDTVTSDLLVDGAGAFLFDVNVQTTVSHPFPQDLDITLTSPSGTVVTLTTDNGNGHADVFNGTLWDDDADPRSELPYVTNDGLATDRAYTPREVATALVPEEALGAFVGENPNGRWILSIHDDTAPDGGLLTAWSLSIVAKSPTLRVVRPLFGENIAAGSRIKVKWKNEGNVGPRVAIQLWRHGALVSTLRASANNDGHQFVRIPVNTPAGGGYRIRVRSESGDTSALGARFSVRSGF
ncbi:MAG TPA: proprotein convertase P-domain-containing protein [Candidatus Hydrogenedentes bacterium]|nr:proprotein convertase P-domain-containing protein [Candidatus Hydrogenedentota bacterium]